TDRLQPAGCRSLLWNERLRESHMSLASTLLPGPVTPTKVLVVDDSEIDQRLAGTLIEKDTGWKAVYARGTEALEVIEREKPSVVLTDLMMHGMSGLE